MKENQLKAIKAVNKCLKSQKLGKNYVVEDEPELLLGQLDKHELIEVVCHYAVWVKIMGDIASRRNIPQIEQLKEMLLL